MTKMAVKALDLGNITGKLEGKEVRELRIEDIEPDPENVRTGYNDAAIQSLADSIRQRGVLQPIIVAPRNDVTGKYRIRYGERRWRGARAAEKETIPAIIDGAAPEDGRRIDQFIENDQRENLSNKDVIAFVVSELDGGTSQTDLAGSLGKSKGYVTNVVRVSKSSADILEIVDMLSIDSAYRLTLAWEIDPKATAAFIKANRGESITQRRAKAFHQQLKDEANELAGRVANDTVEANHKQQSQSEPETERTRPVSQSQSRLKKSRIDLDTSGEIPCLIVDGERFGLSKISASSIIFSASS